MRFVAAASLVAGALALASWPAAPPAAAMVPDARPLAADYYWDWSDGSDARRRTFAQSEYGTQALLPKLIVTAVPALPSHRVKLQFFQDGAWRTEQSGMTDSEGVATLTLNPFCSGAQWCDSTYTYRLTVAGKVVRLVITYVRD